MAEARNKETPLMRGLLESPLPDSNRRPLPYHGLQSLLGRQSSRLQVPISITYFDALREEGPIERGDWVKSAGVMGAFVACVAAANVLSADKNSPYEFTAKQMGPWDVSPTPPTPS